MNEGPPPPVAWMQKAWADAAPHRYPRYDALRSAVACRHGVDASRVMVTAGGDETIDRVMGAARGLHLPSPTFSMFPVYARLRACPLSHTPWDAPVGICERLLDTRPEGTDWIALVAPNNPTGWSVTSEELSAMLAKLPDGVHLLLDQVYAEFDPEPLTEVALEHPRALVVRSFSKSFGLAGLRVGYALGAPELIEALARDTAPFSVAGPCAHVAQRILEAPPPEVSAYWSWVPRARAGIEDALGAAAVLGSRANFVFARTASPFELRERLADRGILVRAFEGASPFEARGTRITCPSNEEDLRRLLDALRSSK